MTDWITVNGAPPSKSNRYRINGNRMYKSEDVTRYEYGFFAQAMKVRDRLIDDFDLELRVFFPDRRQDLDGAFKVVLDCLQKMGAIKNDRKCQSIKAWRFIDKDNPRIELRIHERLNP